MVFWVELHVRLCRGLTFMTHVGLGRGVRAYFDMGLSYMLDGDYGTYSLIKVEIVEV